MTSDGVTTDDNGSADDAGRRQERIDAASAMPLLVERLSALRDRSGRVMLGIVGAPGAGKSTLANDLATALGEDVAAVVPMDGFHIASAALPGPEYLERRGAMDTFDVGGYLSMLKRLRIDTEDVIYAPAFERALEEPMAGAIAVPRSLPIVITEGNYLLSDETPWNEVRACLDETWFVETDHATRLERLIARHVLSGKSLEQATRMATGSDEHNARVVADTRSAADLVIASVARRR
ncbi:nucleoside/nucleotide kinase family protein [Glaciihabitans sp. UYNi722]|uniref:nucleoside/nucleotide kinase family protein n=1 Tax=Glaciihabitans sp. UYNi722 TaxID=3156344 RepID=UPI003393717A